MPDIPEEKDWGILLLRIKDGKCTSSLGSGSCSEKILISSQSANEWVKKYDYLMEDYFYELHIHVYCHDCHAFTTELKARWEAFNRGA